MEHFFENHEIKAFFFKSKDSWKFDLELILQEKSVQNLCRQMQTVLDLNLCPMSMFGLILKNNHFLEKIIYTKLAYHFLYLLSCSQ